MYSIKYDIKRYICGQGTDILEKIKKFNTLEECERYILKMPKIGITEYN